MVNVHDRLIPAPTATVGALLDSLASDNDRLWPHENWPPVTFDRPLQIGATGGHGTGPYTVTAYEPSRRIRLEFAAPRDGFHEFTIDDLDDATCVLRHSLDVTLTATSAPQWYAKVRPLHDALIEDLLDKVEKQFVELRYPHVWSEHVKVLRAERGFLRTRT